MIVILTHVLLHVPCTLSDCFQDATTLPWHDQAFLGCSCFLSCCCLWLRTTWRWSFEKGKWPYYPYMYNPYLWHQDLLSKSILFYKNLSLKSIQSLSFTPVPLFLLNKKSREEHLNIVGIFTLSCSLAQAFM